VLRLIGPEPEVERAVKAFGYPDRPTTTTDMVFVGTAFSWAVWSDCSPSPSQESHVTLTAAVAP